MYAFELPATIPAPGTLGGPPLAADWHNFGGAPGKSDFRLLFLNCVRDPRQLQPTIERMQAEFKALAQQKKK